MFKVIKRQLTSLSKQKYIRKYSITHEGLRILFSIKPRSQKLLLELLLQVSNSSDVDSMTIKSDFIQLGYSSSSNFYRDRKELVKSRLLFYENEEYYINPCYINFYSKRQMDYFFTFFKIKEKKRVTMIDPTSLRLVK